MDLQLNDARLNVRSVLLLFRSLQHRAPFLHTLSITSRGGDGREVAFITYVEPILCLASLEDVTVVFPEKHMIMGNNDLETIMSSWPMIRSIRFFYIYHRDAPFDDFVPSLDVLSGISWMCPQLRSISIPAWSTPVGTTPLFHEMTPRPDHPLTIIKSYRMMWRTLRADEVAHSLHQCFKNLELPVPMSHAATRRLVHLLVSFC